MSEWRLSPPAAKPELTDARLQCHWAAQLVGAAGASLLPERSDYTHTSMTRPTGSALLIGEPIEDHGGDRVGLSVAELRLVRLDHRLRETSACSLAGKTLEDGRRWLCESFESEISLIGYELPPHPVGAGAHFARPGAGFAALAQRFVNASDVLNDLNDPNDGSSETVRCWPHHFDIAHLMSTGGESSVGVGWTPGDGSYDEPYWYVTPWPYPKPATWPKLPSGHWHVQGFVAAILPASEMRAAADGDSERGEVTDFIERAVALSRSLLETESKSDE